jgi:hypothetical protein
VLSLSLQNPFAVKYNNNNNNNNNNNSNLILCSKAQGCGLVEKRQLNCSSSEAISKATQ